MSWKILQGDWIERLRELPDESVNCCVTSPPYFGLRDYGITGQLGLEPSIDKYLEHMVSGFREIMRVLRGDGTLWLNLGDSYATGTTSDRNPTARGKHGYWENPAVNKRIDGRDLGLKPKDLMGIPWRVAFALQSDGWYLRQDIIWSKPNPMPESVRDRCTKAHEYLFLLSKSERYYYDQEAILEECSPNTHARLSQDVEAQIGSERANGGQKTNGNMKAVARSYKGSVPWRKDGPGQDRRSDGVRYGRKLAESGSGIKSNESFSNAVCCLVEKRNRRSVWEVTTQPFSEAHFATFPPKLVEPCILAGCPEFVCSKCGNVIDKEYIIGKRSRTYGNDVPVMREEVPEASVSERPQPLLQQEMYGKGSDSDQTNGLLRMVRQTGACGSEGQAQTILQQGLCIDVHGEASQHNEGVHDNEQGLCCDTDAVASECFITGLRPRTQACDGAEVGEIPAAIRGGSSQERNQVGQPDRELRSHGEAGSRQVTQTAPSRKDQLPPLRSSHSSHPHCPNCNADLLQPGAVGAGTVLDPFSGAGTTGLVATRLQRNFIGIELNPDYIAMAERRIYNDQPLFNSQPDSERTDPCSPTSVPAN